MLTADKCELVGQFHDFAEADQYRCVLLEAQCSLWIPSSFNVVQTTSLNSIKKMPPRNNKYECTIDQELADAAA